MCSFIRFSPHRYRHASSGFSHLWTGSVVVKPGGAAGQPLQAQTLVIWWSRPAKERRPLSGLNWWYHMFKERKESTLNLDYVFCIYTEITAIIPQAQTPEASTPPCVSQCVTTNWFNLLLYRSWRNWEKEEKLVGVDGWQGSRPCEYSQMKKWDLELVTWGDQGQRSWSTTVGPAVMPLPYMSQAWHEICFQILEGEKSNPVTGKKGCWNCSLEASLQHVQHIITSFTQGQITFTANLWNGRMLRLTANVKTSCAKCYVFLK